MEWWPSAGREQWTWGWEPFPAVWLFVLPIAAAYAASVLALRGRRRRRGDPDVTRGQIALFAAGLALVWGALDWPLGLLAAGYLVSANALQDLIVTLGAGAAAAARPPPRATAPRGAARPARSRADAAAPRARLARGGRRDLRDRARGHAPARRGRRAAPRALGLVRDHRRVARRGGGAVVAARRAAGRPPPPALLRRGCSTSPSRSLFPKVVGAFYIFRDDALYDVYAGAPRVWDGFGAVGDQQTGGLLLWVIGSFLVMAALGVLFFRWYEEDRRLSTPDSLDVPADPRAVDALFDVPGGWAALEQLIASVRGALPQRWTGAELAFAFRDLAGRADETQVILELHVALEGPAEAEIARAIEADYGAYLGALGSAQRETIARRLAFRVVGYGSRVS